MTATRSGSEGAVLFGRTHAATAWTASPGLRETMRRFVEEGWAGRDIRLDAAAAKGLDRAPSFYTDDQIFEPYMRGRATYPGRSSHEMANVYLSLAKELGLPDDAQSAAAFQRDVLEWPAFADSVAALKRLRKHFRLVAMTNADRVALSAYAHTLGDPFDDTVCCDETGVAKPDPQFFAYNRGRQAAFGYQKMMVRMAAPARAV